ncbi:MAG: alpha/beta hydrolase family esterase [Acidimicrobiales bacterium]
MRTYLLEVPTAATTGSYLPLVVSFHGYGKTAAEQEAYTQLSAHALHQGVYVITPDGLRDQWNFVRRPTVGASDTKFISSLLASLSQRICYDPHRVVATGISDGADMANTLACAYPGLVAAVFAVAPSIDSQACRRPAASMIEVHGTADPIVPFYGGGGDRPYPFQGTEAVPTYSRVARWATLDHCASGPTQDAVASGVRLEAYSCPSGRQVGLYVIAGGGHTWPGASPIPSLGPTSTAVSADQAVIALAKDPDHLPW